VEGVEGVEGVEEVGAVDGCCAGVVETPEDPQPTASRENPREATATTPERFIRLPSSKARMNEDERV
jgi:hypothetical protein